MMICILCNKTNSHKRVQEGYKCKDCNKVSFYNDIAKNKLLREYVEARGSKLDLEELKERCVLENVNI